VNHKKGRIYIVSIIFIIITICCYVKIKDCVYIKKCGDSIPLKLIYEFSPSVTECPPPYPLVNMLSVLLSNNESTIMIEVSPALTVEHCISFASMYNISDNTSDFATDNVNMTSMFKSSDHGKTWQGVNGEWKKNIKGGITLGWRRQLDPRILMSNINYHVLYDCGFNCKDGFRLSLDNGETWKDIAPKFPDGETIENIVLVETGMHSSSRLYAKIWNNNGYKYHYRMAVSNDYGYHFEMLPWEIQEIVESRANPLRMYARIYLPLYSVFEEQQRSIKGDAYTKFNHLNMVFSNDGGKTWELMEGAGELEPRLYNRRSDSENIHILNQYPANVSTWKQYNDDEEFKLLHEIQWQIESDPTHPDWIYVLKPSGLYISRDAGKTFRLSSLAKEKLFSIDRIAVDPLDSRYLYAVVDMKNLYRSSDYGCTWELITHPLP